MKINWSLQIFIHFGMLILQLFINDLLLNIFYDVIQAFN